MSKADLNDVKERKRAFCVRCHCMHFVRVCVSHGFSEFDLKWSHSHRFVIALLRERWVKTSIQSFNMHVSEANRSGKTSSKVNNEGNV